MWTFIVYVDQLNYRYQKMTCTLEHVSSKLLINNEGIFEGFTDGFAINNAPCLKCEL